MTTTKRSTRKQEEAAERSPKDIEAARGRAYNKAVKALRDAHPADWEQFVREAYASEGLEYRRRLSPREKAQQTIETLLAEFPDLKDDVPF